MLYYYPREFIYYYPGEFIRQFQFGLALQFVEVAAAAIVLQLQRFLEVERPVPILFLALSSSRPRLKWSISEISTAPNAIHTGYEVVLSFRENKMGTLYLTTVSIHNIQQVFASGFRIFSWLDIVKMTAAAAIYQEWSKRYEKLPNQEFPLQATIGGWVDYFNLIQEKSVSILPDFRLRFRGADDV